MNNLEAQPRETWHELLTRAHVKYFDYLTEAPSVEHRQDLGADTILSGVHSNVLNGVCRTRLTSPEAADAIARTVRLFQERQLPAIWYVLAEDQPVNLPEYLVAAGCKPEDSGWVRGGSVHEILPRTNLPPRLPVVIKSVRQAEDFEQWLDVVREVWRDDLDNPPGDLGRRRQLYNELGFAGGSTLQHWVALDGNGNRALGNVTAFYDVEDSVVLIDHVNTVPAARRQRLGTALLRLALEEAQRRGCRWAVLEPSPEGVPLYEATGFQAEQCQPGREFYLPV